MEENDYIVVDVTEPVFGFQIGKDVLRVHSPDKCAGRACCIHNPSNHHMRSWRQNWRADRYLMERVCTHGVGHPDPDDPNPDRVHGCDGCCAPLEGQ